MRKNLTTEEFVNKANIIHKNFYNYSKTVYTNSQSKVIIICPKHGEFEQKANNHLNGQGCMKCKKTNQSKKQTLTTEEFVNKANIIHKNFYDYSKTVYTNSHDYIKIICPKHGEFEQIAYYHLNGNGCYLCGIEKNIKAHKKTTEEFINEANIIHKNFYDYSKTVYTTNHSNIKIICQKHGEFEQMALHHLKGSGCPKCTISKGEKEIANYLQTNNYLFEQQKKFHDLKDIGLLSYDFYLPNENLLIEYNGEQHYRSVKFFGGKKHFVVQKKHDEMKKEYAKKNNINFLVIKYNENINVILDNFLKKGKKHDNKKYRT